MTGRPESSKARYEQYRRDLRNRETEGSRPPEQRDRLGDGKATRRRSFFDLFREFIKLLHGHRGFMIAALGTVTISTILKLIPPAAVGFVVDYVLSDNPAPPYVRFIALPESKSVILTAVAVVLVVIAVISITIGMWGRWHMTRATKRVQATVRRSVFDHAARLPLHRIQRMKSGGIASILREDAGSVADLIFSMLYNPWRAIVTLVGTLFILSTIDWRLLVGSLILIPIVFITHRTWIARIRPLWRDIRVSRQHMDSHATEAFGGMRVVRSFGRQRSEALRFIRNNHVMIRQEVLAWWWSRGVDIAWSVLIPTATAGLLWYGGMRVLDGTLTVGELMMFIIYLAMLLEPLATLAASATAFQNSLAALDRILDIQAEPLEMQPTADTITIDPGSVAGRITLVDVNFRYPGSDELVLRDINLDVSPGELIAFVGPSGSGKTTLCNLIARFYEPTSGHVELDGRDLRDINVESFRRLLGIVEQDIFMFDGTIAENIGYGKRHATIDEITDAAHLANAHEFISQFKRGYNTIVGERGVRLSGGQRQRIAIARAILADPRILILDEATSNLDAESERLIQQSLELLMTGRTSFVIAHRLSTIRHADRIVVLDHGELVEQGTHDELMAASGRYERLVFAQLQQDTPPGDDAPHGMTAADA